MTITVTIPEASQQFAQLIGKVLQGEEIIICENGVAIATKIRNQNLIGAAKFCQSNSG